MIDTLLAHAPLALGIARGFRAKLPPWVLTADIEQAALVGLWQALRRSSRPHTLEQRCAYIKRRVRGAIVDELRRQDWGPRRKPSTTAARPVIVRLDELGYTERTAVTERPSDDPCPSVVLDAERALAAPLNAVDRRCVELVFLQGKTCTEAAPVLGMSEPRVHQRLRRALRVMRAWLERETGET